MPTAAETKFCTASPTICTRWPCVDSPEYACQLVFVTKLTAVFQAARGSSRVPGSLRCSGSFPCSNCRKQEQDADRGEGEHAAGIGAQVCSDFRVGADQPVDDALTARCLVGGVDAVHVVAERHVDGREGEDQGDEEQDPRRNVVATLEPLGEEQGGEEKERETNRRTKPTRVGAHSRSTDLCTSRAGRRSPPSARCRW